MSWHIAMNGLYGLLGFGVLGWLISLYRNNVTHVDSMWSLFFVIAALIYVGESDHASFRSVMLITLLGLWAVRLSAYLTWRNWGPHEDHRYAEIRANNSPHFALKSLYIVFGLQALLAWLIAFPVYGAIASDAPLNGLDILGAGVIFFGLVWETVADWQLAVFKRNDANRNKVLNKGLWRYSRHPNYFGECMVWWGIYGVALAAGAWWTIFSPILMTLLLLQVSGVKLLEKDIAERRPEYIRYVRTTSAFIPCKPKDQA